VQEVLGCRCVELEYVTIALSRSLSLDRSLSIALSLARALPRRGARSLLFYLHCAENVQEKCPICKNQMQDLCTCPRSHTSQASRSVACVSRAMRVASDLRARHRPRLHGQPERRLPACVGSMQPCLVRGGACAFITQVLSLFSPSPLARSISIVRYRAATSTAFRYAIVCGGSRSAAHRRSSLTRSLP